MRIGVFFVNTAWLPALVRLLLSWLSETVAILNKNRCSSMFFKILMRYQVFHRHSLDCLDFDEAHGTYDQRMRGDRKFKGEGKKSPSLLVVRAVRETLLTGPVQPEWNIPSSIPVSR